MAYIMQKNTHTNLVYKSLQSTESIVQLNLYKID